jgi:hypothetical protein
MDGFVLDVPDTDDNVEAFKRSQNGPHPSAFPQVRIVGLGECGSHAVIAAAVGSCRTGEETLATELADSFEAGMLVMAIVTSTVIRCGAKH